MSICSSVTPTAKRSTPRSSAAVHALLSTQGLGKASVFTGALYPLVPPALARPHASASHGAAARENGVAGSAAALTAASETPTHESPKSNTRAPPSASSIVLAGLMSWCTMPSSCRRATARAICAATTSAPSRLRSAGAGDVASGSACRVRNSAHTERARAAAALSLLAMTLFSSTPSTRSLTSAGMADAVSVCSPRNAGKGAPGGHAAPEQMSSPSADSFVAMVLARAMTWAGPPLSSAVFTASVPSAAARTRSSSGNSSSPAATLRAFASTTPNPPCPSSSLGPTKSSATYPVAVRPQTARGVARIERPAPAASAPPPRPRTANAAMGAFNNSSSRAAARSREDWAIPSDF